MATKTLSRQEMIKQRTQLDAAIAAQYQSDLKALVEQFKVHLEAGEFELPDALALLSAGKSLRAKRGTAAPKAPTSDRPTPGVTYRDPKTGLEWTAPVNLRRVKKWLAELVSGTGKKYDDFAAKK